MSVDHTEGELVGTRQPRTAESTADFLDESLANYLSDSTAGALSDPTADAPALAAPAAAARTRFRLFRLFRRRLAIKVVRRRAVD